MNAPMPVDAGDGPIVLETPRLRLYLPPADHAPLVLDYYTRNREHLSPWSPLPAEGFYTEAFWRQQLERNRTEAAAGRGLRTFARLVEGQGDDGAAAPIVASCNLSNVVRGAFQAAHLGYSMDAELQGRGLMTEAVAALVDHAFDGMGLHRVMANYIPRNQASGRLLRKLGFRVEGYARDYLRIAGSWQDHILTARTRPTTEE